MSSAASAIAKDKPDWAGEDWLSRLVNVLIKTKPLYSLMKYQARKVLISTAEKNGVPWRQTVKDLEQSKATQYFTEIQDKSLEYPDYYQVPFHAYDEGNLCWKAAFEAAPATESMALRVWKNETLTPEVAQARLRNSFLDVVEQYLPDCNGTGKTIAHKCPKCHGYWLFCGDFDFCFVRSPETKKSSGAGNRLRFIALYARGGEGTGQKSGDSMVTWKSGSHGICR